jgi:superkiller protein 3
MATHVRKPPFKKPPEQAIQKDGLFTGTAQAGPARRERAHALAEELLARGCLYIQKGIWDEAAREFRKAIQMEPQYPEAFNDLGLCLFYMKKYNEAIETLHEAIRFFPGWYIAEANLGLALAHVGRHAEAAQHYERSLTIKEQPAVSLALGDVYTALGKFDNAVPAYQKALAGNPNYSLAYHRIGMLQARRNQIDEAETALEKAVELDAANHEGWAVLGAIAARKGNLSKARGLFAKVEAIEKVPAPAQRGLNRMQVFGKGIEKAFTEWKAGMPAPSPLAQCYYNLGLALLKADNQGAARNAFQQASAADPEWFEPLVWFGFFAALDGDAMSARKQWESALKLHPDNGMVWEQLGYLAVAMGLQKDGETNFAEAAKNGRAIPQEHIFPDKSVAKVPPQPNLSKQDTTTVRKPKSEPQEEELAEEEPELAPAEGADSGEDLEEAAE